MTPYKRLPPLNGLRVFEVAARHMSFTRAAAELCVTNAAVSHQVKQLEEFLGLKLFERRNNQLLLTRAGENYLPRIREAFRAVQMATELLLDGSTQPLRIGVSASLGSKWLVPRLYRFLGAHPELRVEVVTEADQQSVDAVDLLIAERRHADPGVRSERFATTRFFPVCCPQLNDGLCRPEDLLAQTLLHEHGAQRLSHQPGWRQWFDEVGLDIAAATRGLGLGDALMSLQAAIDGQGIALGQDILVEYDLAAGRLVRPIDVETSLRLSYYLVYREAAPQRDGFAPLRDWLFAEAEGGNY